MNVINNIKNLLDKWLFYSCCMFLTLLFEVSIVGVWFVLGRLAEVLSSLRFFSFLSAYSMYDPPKHAVYRSGAQVAR
jgi:hypothetical protein